MAKASNSSKLVLFLLVALVGGAAGFGYFKQSEKLGDAPPAPAQVAPKAPAIPAIDATLLAPRPTDIILGDANAMITMVEYSSLSCPHCAQFHKDILPTIEREYITTGKVKLIVRYYPLNEPALKAAQTVECAGKNGLKREDFLKTLFDMQAQWAMDDKFLKNIKQIAIVGGLDSASFESCVNDKALETSILSGMQEASTKLEVRSTPTFFINGTKFVGDPTVEKFRDALNAAEKNSK